MAVWADRELPDSREDVGEHWEGGSWASDSDGELDALFGSLGGDAEDELEPDTEDFMAMTLEDAQTPLELVERLSWDATSQDSSDEEQDALQLPSLLNIQVDKLQENRQQQWTLVSPGSEAASPPVYLSPLTRVSISSSARQQRLLEPESEPVEGKTEQVLGLKEEEDEEEQVQDSEDSEEEVKAFDPETCWSPHSSSILFSSASKPVNPFASAEPEEPEASDDNAGDNSASEDETQEQSERESALRPSLLPRVPSITQWRRQKARTCSGAGSAGMPSSLSLATFKARTRSLSWSRNESVDEDDDGDFSSDDEGYTPELHHRRGSETESFGGGSHWRRARNTSINFPSQRLSVSLNMSPAMMTKRLQNAKSKLSHGLYFMRSGSTTSTVTSEESYLDSPYCDEYKSAPAELQQECSSYPSFKSAETSNDQHHTSRQQQLRAGVFKAAGYLNAASAEAARKLKSRAGGFRAPHLPRHKNAASETEEEELEGCTPPPPVSSFSVEASITAP